VFKRFLENERRHEAHWKVSSNPSQPNRWCVAHKDNSEYVQTVTLLDGKLVGTCSTTARHGYPCRHCTRMASLWQDIDICTYTSLWHDYWKADRVPWRSTVVERDGRQQDVVLRSADHSIPRPVPRGRALFLQR
jgi:hypothetical protein